MHKLDCVRAQTIKAYTYSSFSVAFVLVYSIVQMASDLSTGHPLFSEIICFSLSSVVLWVSWTGNEGGGHGDTAEEGGEWWVNWRWVGRLAATGDTGVCVYLCVWVAAVHIHTNTCAHTLIISFHGSSERQHAKWQIAYALPSCWHSSLSPRPLYPSLPSVSFSSSLYFVHLFLFFMMSEMSLSYVCITIITCLDCWDLLLRMQLESRVLTISHILRN